MSSKKVQCFQWEFVCGNLYWLDKKDYKAFLDDPDKSFFVYNFNNNDAQSPIKQLMYNRINNLINDLNSRALDDDTITTDTNCNYFTIDEFNDL